MLLLGTGTGLAPLVGIARDALAPGHRGPIHLFHGSRARSGLYLEEVLKNLAGRFPNFSYFPCLSGEDVPAGYTRGRADDVALEAHPDLTGWRVFLCGAPDMVRTTKRRAYLAGARLDDIHADPFDLKDLRREPR